MKKFYILLFSVLFLNSAWTQSCLPEGITFVSQPQIDSFQINYPGCKKIEGDVTINDTTSNGIKNLNGLNVLSSIKGDLFIGYGRGLEDLSGLDSLTTVDGKFSSGCILKREVAEHQFMWQSKTDPMIPPLTAPGKA